MIERFIHWFIEKYYPDFIMIPKDEFRIFPDIQPITDDIKSQIKPELYNKVLALVRNIEGSKSLGQYKRINVVTAIKAECRRLDLPEWPERDINLAIELAVREL